jgi:hypothetical protein
MDLEKLDEYESKLRDDFESKLQDFAAIKEIAARSPELVLMAAEELRAPEPEIPPKAGTKKSRTRKPRTKKPSVKQTSVIKPTHADLVGQYLAKNPKSKTGAIQAATGIAMPTLRQVLYKGNEFTSEPDPEDTRKPLWSYSAELVERRPVGRKGSAGTTEAIRVFLESHPKSTYQEIVEAIIDKVDTTAKPRAAINTTLRMLEKRDKVYAEEIEGVKRFTLSK